jgi:hypothetical protein
MSIEIETELKRKGKSSVKVLIKTAKYQVMHVFATENKITLLTFVFPQLFLEVSQGVPSDSLSGRRFLPHWPLRVVENPVLETESQAILQITIREVLFHR